MTDEPEGEFVDALGLFWAAARPVLASEAPWRRGPGPAADSALPWPLPESEDGYNRLLQWLTRHIVAVCSADAKQHGWTFMESAQDGRFQAILQVVKHAVDAGDAALRASFPARYRLQDKQAFKNWLKLEVLEQLKGQGPLTAEAIAASGIPRRTAYRAQSRAHQRRQKHQK